MRLKPLPDSVPALESYLRAAEQFLEANNYPDRVWDRVSSEFPRDTGRSIAEILTWHDEHKFIDDLYRDAELRRPACMNFVDFVDWPFRWEASEHEGVHALGFIRATDAYLERRWWKSRHDPSPSNMPRKAILDLVRDIRAKLEHLARRPAPGGDKPSLELRGNELPPLIRGVACKKRLTAKQYKVVAALLAAFPAGITEDDLIVRSGIEGARNTLNNLRLSKPPVWEDVLLMSGRDREGYRINVW